MSKKISMLAVAAILTLPGVMAEASEPVEERIEALTRELENLRGQVAEVQAANEKLAGEVQKKQASSPAAAPPAARIELEADLRNRLDFHRAETMAHWAATDVATGITTFTSAQPVMAGIAGMFPDVGTMLVNLGPAMADLDTWRATLVDMSVDGESPFTDSQEEALFYMFTNQEVSQMLTAMAAMPATTISDAMATPETLAAFMRNLSPAARQEIFTNMGFNPVPARKYENDTLWTTRLRLNMNAWATESIQFRARIVGYKGWGSQDHPMPETTEDGIHDISSPYFLNSRTFDGTVGRKPVGSELVLDRAFLSWWNVGGQPIWFSIGRRPTTDGPPAELRLGLGERQGTPVNFMDYPFDGLTIGYAYWNLPGIKDAPGRIRFCYGRGFEAGPQQKDTGLKDVDFAGINWDIYDKGNRFLNIQSFGAFNIFNVPGDTRFPNPIEQATGAGNGFLDRTNLGNIYHTSAVYMDKIKNLNYFLTLGWSRTDPKSVDELGNSLLSDFWDTPEEKNGYAVYAGIRYDIDAYRLKLGAEYNYGSENWLAFTPGHDDMYASKLATRGSAYEVYGIWDIPAGAAVSKVGKAFMRLGYQHIKHDYTYSGMWLGTPRDISGIKNDPLAAQFYAPLEQVDQVYLTLEAWF
jgi:hypothetical protein